MKQKKIEEVTKEFWDNEVNEENKELIEDFLGQEQLSPATRKQYESALKIFAKWIHDNYRAGKLIPDLKPRDARKYQDWLLKKGLSPNAVKFKRSAVSSLCLFIEAYYDDTYPDFRNIFTKAVKGVAKTNVKDKVPLTSAEINKLKKALKKNGEWQKLAYLLFSFDTGCRREESRQLLKEVANYKYHVDSEGNVKKYYLTHNIRAKGEGVIGKVRKFSFNDETMEAIRKWLEVRGEDDCPHLFVSKTKDGYRQLSANSFNLWCEEFSKLINKKVHPHLLRSSRATIAIVEEGKSIESVQGLLGHNSSETTQIYVVRDKSSDLDELYD
ncbi:tyrosine-type recombinase/integrase [Klebsiella pneumoniae]|nr:tyrosine-type recombinase/integrase [Klebsiella pneumoniae]MDS7714320.1 tyrosine-type recombinase/integrase [Klebsiella pneumoniae]UUV46191.1 site-specific tyrosine recombinase [Bacillus phage vB_BanS-Thrax2]